MDIEEEEPKFIWAARRKRVADIIMPKVNFTIEFVCTYWLQIIIGSVILNILRVIYKYMYRIWVRW